MPVPNPSIVFALFNDRAWADIAMAKLREAGFSPDQLELTTSGDMPPARPGEEPGGILSPIRALLLGGNRSAAELFEHLVELGIPDDEARKYREQVEQGQLLVTVISMCREREAADLWRQHGGRGAFEAQPEVSGIEENQPQLVREEVAPPDEIKAD